MPFDPKEFAEQWKVRLDAEKEVLEARHARDELLLEQIDIKREAAQEWIDEH